MSRQGLRLELITSLMVVLVALAIPFAACSQSTSLDSYTLLTVDPEEWEAKNIFDEHGIIQVDYGDRGIQYNPITIAQYAIANYEKYMSTREDKYKITFLTQFEYLRNNFDVISDEMIGFPYHFPVPNYGLEPVFYSGMAQGQAISVFARAYLLTHDETILPLIKKANNFMLHPVSDGGTLRYTPEGNVWIE